MKHMGRRIGCAALAAQMLLSPAAQAAQPLQKALDESLRAPLMSRAADLLEHAAKSHETFPQLRKLSRKRVVASSAGNNGENVAAGAALNEYSENENPNTAAPDLSAEEEASKEATTPATSDDGDEGTTSNVSTEGDASGETTAPGMTTETDPSDETTTPDVSTGENAANEAMKPAAPAEDGAVGEPVETVPPVETTVPDMEATAPLTPAEGTPAGDVVLPPPETTNVIKPEKKLNRPPRGGVSLFSVGVSGMDDYLDTTTVLAIFGFGPEYRIPGSKRTDGVAENYAYNIEDPADPADRSKAKSWFDYRYNGTANEIWADADGDSDVLERRFNGLFAYLYAQTYTVKDMYLNQGGAYSDEEFEWSEDGVDQYFIGVLPGSPAYENKYGIDLPRLPNKEFTNEWYVLGSKELVTGGNPGFSVYDPVKDSYYGSVEYTTFIKFLQDNSNDTDYRNYQNVTYAKDRDVLFEPDVPLSTYEYGKGPLSADGNHMAMMDSFRDNSSFDLPTTLPLIGRWKDSSNATLTALGLTQKLVEPSGTSTEKVALYPVKADQPLSGLEKKTYLELQQADQGFEEETEEYFLRLPAAAKELTLTANEVISYEPGSQVTLYAEYGVGSDPVEYVLKGTETVTVNAFGEPDNSFDDPARSIWMLDDAAPAVPVVNGEGKVLTKIVLHVLPPSKEEDDAKDYTLHIQQLQPPRLEKDPGNTPMGMIQRNIGRDTPDIEGYDATWTEEQKQQATENFQKRLSFRTSDNKFLFPGDSVTNNGGFLWRGDYSAEAWTGALNDPTVNVDLDPSAIVVYPNTSFNVPGFSVVDSLGQTSVGATEIVDPKSDLTGGGGEQKIQNVKWKLELTTVDKLLPDGMTDVAPNSEDTWSGEGNIEKISLIDYKVKPGVYKLSYTYTDEYDGREHTGGSFDRTVVVLPLHGDVDLDGEVTPADGIALKALVGSDPEQFKTRCLQSATGRLYYYRVCNLDDSSTVDSADVERLLQGYTPQMRDMLYKSSDYFYLPLPGGTPREAKDFTATAGPGRATLALQYLGAGASAPDDGGRVNYDPAADSVFWMDVQLKDPDLLAAAAGELTSFTVTLTYNNDYVEPYLPEGHDTWSQYVLGLNPQWQDWEIQMVREYELVNGQIVGKLIETDITPVNTPSKAKSLLGAWASEGALREARFSVTPGQAAANQNPLTMGGENGSILKVPFRLKKFPAGKTGQDLKLVELALGPRDLLLTTVNNGEVRAALWDNNPAYQIPTTDNVNLQKELNFAGSDDVKLGQDVTPCYYVYVSQPDYAADVESSSAYGKNLVYGYGQKVTMNAYGVLDGVADEMKYRKYFSDADADAVIEWKDPVDLPGDYSYDPTLRTLTVTPERAGIYDFTLTGSDIPYRLVVDKAPLTLTVDDVKKFYGETTDVTTAKTFTYDKKQIADRDAGNGNNSGLGSDLAGVINTAANDYVAPSITLRPAAEKEEEISANTLPGDYSVVIKGGLSQNYIFNYVRADKPAADKEHISSKLGTAKLTVLPRPLLVDKVTKDPAGTLAESIPQLFGIEGKAKVNEFSRAGVDARPELTGYDSATKTIGGVPITAGITVVSGDSLELAYVGVARQNKDDPEDGFHISGEKEERAADITSIALTENSETRNGCYVLKNKEEEDPANPGKKLTKPLDDAATASVEKRKMLRMEVIRQPTQLNYIYGQTLDLRDLWVEAYFTDKPMVDVQAFHSLENLESVLGVEAFWVDDAAAVPAADAEPATDGEQLHVADRDGKYLYLRDAGTKSVFAYVGPFHVDKRPLTLTLRTETRYYGESIADWTVGYNFGQLAQWDRMAHPQVSGNIDDLAAWMDGFTQPVAVPRETKSSDGKPVTETTDVGSYYTIISGAAAADYKFNYTRTGLEGAEGESDAFGYAPLNIERRPILITGVTGSAGSMYHDTRSLFVDPAKAVAGGDAAEFQTALPQMGVSYYTGDFTTYTWDGRWGLSSGAIHVNDTLTALYQGEFLDPDNNQMPFYELRSDEPSREVQVKVTGLRLSGERSKNYLLLFPSADAATNGWAGESEATSHTIGFVYQRRIVGIELSGPTKVRYEYGERLSLLGLTAQITYAGENGESGVVETVAYSDITLGGVNTTTFKRLGLTLHMGSSNGAAVENGQKLSVAEHNGRFLYVTGPQYAGGSVVSDRTPQPLRVSKRKLELTVSDIERKYGEENGQYQYTFALSDMAEWDRDLVGEHELLGTAQAQHTASVSAALAAVNAPYENGGSGNGFVPPRFSTQAVYNSPVKGSPYSLDLTGGSMANYELVTHSGKIHVEPRPIRVENVLKDPLYTLSENEFSASGSGMAPTFSNVVCTQAELELSISAGDGVSGLPVVSGDHISLNIVSGSVIGNWSGTNWVTAPNGNGQGFGDGEYQILRNAQISKIKLLDGGDNDNYRLTNPVNQSGELSSKIEVQNKIVVHRREVEAIRVVQDPNKMVYTYGEPLDLSGMLLEITYKKGDAFETVKVDPTAMRDVFINYWDPDIPTPTGAELDEKDSLLQVHPAASGDHVTIAVDNEGFAHNRMKLMVSARTYKDRPYVDSVLTSAPVVVKPRELTYTLAAEDKDYDHSRDAAGTITLTNVYGDDEVWVKNGMDYTGSVPPDHAFSSGDYHAEGGYDGLKFAFVDENVSYRLSDGHDMFLDILDIPVEVTGIALDGWDQANYHINEAVLTSTVQIPGRDGVPSARILPIERPAPAPETTLWVDEHTNTVKVLTALPAESFGDEADSRNSLHYEYALIYENELGGIVLTDYQDDPYFGGEPVTVEKVDHVPDENAPIEGGAGQKLDPADALFGSEKRTALPRGTWMGALVRIAGTNNYFPSAGQTSYDPELQVREDDNNDAELLTALGAAAQAAAARPLPEPGKDERQTERLEGVVIKTYTYRVDIVSTSKQKDEAGKEVYVPALEAVWFTDIAAYEDDRALNRMVENITPTRYYGYYWDSARSVSLHFPLLMSEDILAEIPVAGGASGEKTEQLMNPNGTARIYVSLSSPGGGGGGVGNPRHLEIIPEELTLEGPGKTAQLRVRVSPADLIERGVIWSSSDESVVIVAANGKVTAIGPGVATITATAQKGGVSDSITVTVLGERKPPQKVEYPYSGTMFNSAYLGAFFDLPADGRFEPERTMTRRELAVVMNRFFQAVEGRLPGELSYYKDLQDADPRNSSIMNLDRWGIVTGIEEEIFAPDRIVTRAEMSVMLCRMLLIPVNNDPDAPHAFADARPGIHWAWAYIDALAKAGITKGTGDNEYSPERLLTRAEVATFLCRSLITTIDRTKGPLVVPTDVTENHWAYPYILRAVNSEPAVRLIDEYLPREETTAEGEKK